ncbi:brain-specific angiogenesis inhibitor 1-associated protein 2-like protein 2 isoform X2 [Oryzias melastigma]|uniref:brain-specific angiogenesis inhibitor 1-associated protein 2-like protein 2 isoform X2 n=1 Tax=Oryzias melastigma TaxID=30732 RepID=UPI000CF7F8FF|nr:brain-specific angiogenesis inhibitor 1-associated protein 2-like protein 2 isoform X2 [Oryzias melastigma]
MSGVNTDHLHRSTLGIYTSLTEEFNPSLLKLVSLGNSYVQAFKALAATSEAYFSALSKIGQNALNTMSSRSLGDVLIQISENQRRLNMELEGMFSWFNSEVLQKMETNVRLDRNYLSDSRVKYETLVHNQERQLRRGASQDFSEFERFLRESHGEALKEEERRFRFLAEKHSSLMQSAAQLMNRTGGNLQHRAEAWTEDISVTRQPEIRRPASVGRTDGMKMKEDNFIKGRDEEPLGNIPSRAPSPQGSVSRLRLDSTGGAAGERTMRAKVAYRPTDVNPSMLTFSKGERVIVMSQQPKNGWLYGRNDNGSRKGWFPAAFVEPAIPPESPMSSRNSTIRGSNISLNSLPPASNQGGAAPPPPPPPPPPQSLPASPSPQSQPSTVKRAPESQPENKRPQVQDSRPELFPRGTNPFATVKLKPTSTNDRSAPRLYRR